MKHLENSEMLRLVCFRGKIEPNLPWSINILFPPQCRNKFEGRHSATEGRCVPKCNKGYARQKMIHTVKTPVGTVGSLLPSFHPPITNSQQSRFATQVSRLLSEPRTKSIWYKEAVVFKSRPQGWKISFDCLMQQPPAVKIGMGERMGAETIRKKFLGQQWIFQCLIPAHTFLKRKRQGLQSIGSGLASSEHKEIGIYLNEITV